MSDLTFVTGNNAKFAIGESICDTYGIKLVQQELTIDEIQSEDSEIVAFDKSNKIYNKLHKPVIISDDTWLIPGLNDFPGPYMKSMNEWFTSEDWLRLTSELKNREIILRLIVVYKDELRQRSFISDIPGTLMKEIKGSSKYTHTAVTSFNGGMTSLAEDIANKHFSSNVPNSAWHKFAAWYAGNIK